jgi:hypothetical protein
MDLPSTTTRQQQIACGPLTPAYVGGARQADARLDTERTRGATPHVGDDGTGVGDAWCAPTRAATWRGPAGCERVNGRNDAQARSSSMSSSAR